MVVLDTLLTKIESERKDKIDKIEKVSMGFPDFQNIEKHENSENVLKIKFSMKISYEPEAASATYEGIIVYKTEKADDVIKAWKDNKKLEKSLGMDVINVAYSICLSKSVKIFEDMKLPVQALLQMPKIETKKKESSDKTEKKEQ